MSNYKRLTNNNSDEYDPEYDFCCGCQYFGEPCGCNRPNGTCDSYDCFLETYDRLAELEDKIENGTLIETPKIGQTMYGFSVRKQLIEFTVIAITIDSLYNITVWDDDDNDFVVGENGFYSFEQAQSKLKELQGKEK